MVKETHENKWENKTSSNPNMNGPQGADLKCDELIWGDI